MNWLVPVMVGAPDGKYHNIVTSNSVSNTHKYTHLCGHYIAGLWEGDGHIWISKTSKSTPHFCITFHEKEYPIVFKLKQILGGNIRHKRKEHAYVSDLINNHWLAGFIDADGSFDASIRKIKDNSRIIIRFRLEQRMFDSKTSIPYEPILRQISKEFKLNLGQSIHADAYLKKYQ
ncbi:hypothetical protein HK099_004740 [Clydaea vesicula]|uniref:Homing endonuclease LAGLIDADG domain-containing protein n=1 Tax=Clydaea vesicula TaxID=447962 RepID=A0AAD5U2M3_9FUNG|nr:hypothetical protein HK099_004740 [Clydaea vesicula]